jgi:hypothetical protein
MLAPGARSIAVSTESKLHFRNQDWQSRTPRRQRDAALIRCVSGDEGAASQDVRVVELRPRAPPTGSDDEGVSE